MSQNERFRRAAQPPDAKEVVLSAGVFLLFQTHPVSSGGGGFTALAPSFGLRLWPDRISPQGA